MNYSKNMKFYEMWLWPFFIFCVNTFGHNLKWISVVFIGHLSGHWWWITTKTIIGACDSDIWFQTFCPSFALLKIQNADFFTFIRFSHITLEHICLTGCRDDLISLLNPGFTKNVIIIFFLASCFVIDIWREFFVALNEPIVTKNRYKLYRIID